MPVVNQSILKYKYRVLLIIGHYSYHYLLVDKNNFHEIILFIRTKVVITPNSTIV